MSKIKSYVSSVDGRWGKCYYIKDDEYVGKSLKNYGEYNPDETEFILALAAERGGLILDIGANIGTITQALVHNGYHVAAFEPQKALFDILELNAGDRADLYNVALGEKAGTTRMPKVQYHVRGNFGGISCGSGEIEVPLRTLDSYQFNNVGLIKLDVEGFEEYVLRGGLNTILDSKPWIYLEADRAEKIPYLKHYVTEVLKYSWVEHQPTLYRENNYFGKKVNVWAPMNFASHNVLCKPL